MEKSNNYIGIMVEIPVKFQRGKLNFIKLYDNKEIIIRDYYRNGKVFMERRSGMLLVKSTKIPKAKTGLTYFSIMMEVEELSEAKRLIGIINTLGNEKIIKEKISMFVNNKSLISSLSELSPIKNAIIDLNTNKQVENLIEHGNYYIPTAFFVTG